MDDEDDEDDDEVDVDEEDDVDDEEEEVDDEPDGQPNAFVVDKLLDVVEPPAGVVPPLALLLLPAVKG